MKRVLTFLLFVVATGSGCAQSKEPGMDDQQAYIDKMANNLQLSAVWMVEHGIETHAREGKEGIFRKLLNAWGVQQWVEPVIGGRYLALFRIKARQMKANVMCLSRTTEGGVYEYWLVQFSGEEWKNSPVGKERHCLFLITHADNVSGVRRVVHQAKQFFPSYKVNEHVTVSLPLDNLELQYDMMAWEFPECYPDSDLKNWEVGIGSDGRYVRVPAKR
jgi:hypothetical protein